jgi:hypothetical protein
VDVPFPLADANGGKDFEVGVVEKVRCLLDEGNLSFGLDPSHAVHHVAAIDHLNNKKIMNHGLESLDWLLKIQTTGKTKHVSLVGNAGWFSKGGRRSQFDQQPIDAYCLMEACSQAFDATGDDRWKQEIDRAFLWFLGKNDKNECLYDFRTGGCCDGLQRGGINLNQGAESTLSWLAALHLMYRISHKGIDVLPQDERELIAREESKENES